MPSSPCPSPTRQFGCWARTRERCSQCVHRTCPRRTLSLRAICCPGCHERRHCESWDTNSATIAHRRYSQTNHIVVSPYEGVQAIPDKQLAAVGAMRSSCIRVPYFGVALQCLPGTELVLTLTSGMTSVIKNDHRLRLVKAPKELHALHFLMAWHPRLNTDPRHMWLRRVVRSSVVLNE
jgi:hypothetical protein